MEIVKKLKVRKTVLVKSLHTYIMFRFNLKDKSTWQYETFSPFSDYDEENDSKPQISGARYFSSDLVIIFCVSMKFISLMWKSKTMRKK